MSSLKRLSKPAQATIVSATVVLGLVTIALSACGSPSDEEQFIDELRQNINSTQSDADLADFGATVCELGRSFQGDPSGLADRLTVVGAQHPDKDGADLIGWSIKIAGKTICPETQSDFKAAADVIMARS